MKLFRRRAPHLLKSNRFFFVIEPFQQISRPTEVRVDLSAEGYRVEWEPPALGADILAHYVVRWHRHGHERLTETLETTDTAVTSE